MMFKIDCLDDLRKIMKALDNDDRLEILCHIGNPPEYKIIRLRVKDKLAFELHEIRQAD